MTRTYWVDEYLDGLLSQYRTDPEAAAARFDVDMNDMGDDPLVARSLDRLAECCEMHENLAYLIEWNEHPTLRAELQRVIDAIKDAGGDIAPLIDDGGPTGPGTDATANRVWLEDLPYAKWR